MPNDPRRARELGFLFALAGVGVEMVLPIVLGMVIDAHFGWPNWATITGVVVGFVISLTHIMVLKRWYDRQNQQPGDKP